MKYSKKKLVFGDYTPEGGRIVIMEGACRHVRQDHGTSNTEHGQGEVHVHKSTCAKRNYTMIGMREAKRYSSKANRWHTHKLAHAEHSRANAKRRY